MLPANTQGYGVVNRPAPFPLRPFVEGVAKLIKLLYNGGVRARVKGFLFRSTVTSRIGPIHCGVVLAALALGLFSLLEVFCAVSLRVGFPLLRVLVVVGFRLLGPASLVGPVVSPVVGPLTLPALSVSPAAVFNR